MNRHRLAAGLITSALILGTAIPAGAAPTSGIAATHAAPAAAIIAAHTAAASASTTDFAPWMLPGGWEAIDVIANSTNPAVTALYADKAKEDGSSPATVKQKFLNLASCGDVRNFYFTRTHLRAVGYNGADLFTYQYRMAKRVSAKNMQAFFFEATIGKKAGDRRWLILFPPGADKHSTTGKDMAIHAHYMMGSTPLTVVDNALRFHMPTIVEAGATFDEKFIVLQHGVQHF